MLKFFRQIRKKLIEQDNVRKYLLYAIGEISGRIYEEKWTNVDFDKLTSKFHAVGTNHRNYLRLLNLYLPRVRLETERLIKELEESM